MSLTDFCLGLEQGLTMLLDGPGTHIDLPAVSALCHHAQLNVRSVEAILLMIFFAFFSPLTRLLFPPKDDHTLKFLYDDNQRVEPEWYIPIIPMVLINGAEGIGTGWSCKIPNFDVREVVNNIRRLLDGEEPLPMVSVLG